VQVSKIVARDQICDQNLEKIDLKLDDVSGDISNHFANTHQVKRVSKRGTLFYSNNTVGIVPSLDGKGAHCIA
jgi:hypothetical protein